MVKAPPLQIVAVCEEIKGLGFTVTVRLKFVPVQGAEVVGVIM
jgi:hypothetical protein